MLRTHCTVIYLSVAHIRKLSIASAYKLQLTPYLASPKSKPKEAFKKYKKNVRTRQLAPFVN